MDKVVKGVSQEVKQAADRLVNNVSKVIVGKQETVELVLVALLCEGHVLIEDIPGIGKTMLAKAVARSLGCSFKRIQSTPDLLPSDITGTHIFNQKTSDFELKPGPVMAQVVLADEINRATPRTQSALLEAMQERQITIEGETEQLPRPFLVLATQNPIELEGTFPLPEAQLDRFMLKIRISYPDKAQEHEILRKMARSNPNTDVDPIIMLDDVKRLRGLTDEIYMDEKIEEYIVNIVETSRNPEVYRLDIGQFIRYGASPRASIFLAMASKANALIEGRGYVTPQDVKTVAMNVLRHRIILTYEAEAEEKTSEDIIEQILQTVDVP